MKVASRPSPSSRVFTSSANSGQSRQSSSGVIESPCSCNFFQRTKSSRTRVDEVMLHHLGIFTDTQHKPRPRVCKHLSRVDSKFATVFWDGYGQFGNCAWDTHNNHYPRLREYLLPG